MGVQELSGQIVNQFADLPLLPRLLALIEVNGVLGLVKQLANGARTTVDGLDWRFGGGHLVASSMTATRTLPASGSSITPCLRLRMRSFLASPLSACNGPASGLPFGKSASGVPGRIISWVCMSFSGVIGGHPAVTGSSPDYSRHGVKEVVSVD